MKFDYLRQLCNQGVFENILKVIENFQLIGLLSGGHIHDPQCAGELLSKVKLEGKMIRADKAFRSAQIRDFI